MQVQINDLTFGQWFLNLIYINEIIIEKMDTLLNVEEDDNVSSINAVELDVQDSKIGSSSQLICKNEDTYDPQKVRI